MGEINYPTELINLSSVRALKTLISHYLFLLRHTRLSTFLICQREKKFRNVKQHYQYVLFITTADLGKSLQMVLVTQNLLWLQTVTGYVNYSNSHRKTDIFDSWSHFNSS